MRWKTIMINWSRVEILRENGKHRTKWKFIFYAIRMMHLLQEIVWICLWNLKCFHYFPTHHRKKGAFYRHCALPGNVPSPSVPCLRFINKIPYSCHASHNDFPCHQNPVLDSIKINPSGGCEREWQDSPELCCVCDSQCMTVMMCVRVIECNALGEVSE